MPFGGLRRAHAAPSIYKCRPWRSDMGAVRLSARPMAAEGAGQRLAKTDPRNVPAPSIAKAMDGAGQEGWSGNRITPKRIGCPGP